MFVCYLFLFLSILIVLLLFVWQGNTTLEMGLFWREFFLFLIERRILLSLYAFSHTIFLRDCFLHHKKDKNSWYEKNRGSLLVFPSFRWITMKLVKDMKKENFTENIHFSFLNQNPYFVQTKQARCLRSMTGKMMLRSPLTNWSPQWRIWWKKQTKSSRDSSWKRPTRLYFAHDSLAPVGHVWALLIPSSLVKRGKW